MLSLSCYSKERAARHRRTPLLCSTCASVMSPGLLTKPPRSPGVRCMPRSALKPPRILLTVRLHARSRISHENEVFINTGRISLVMPRYLSLEVRDLEIGLATIMHCKVQDRGYFLEICCCYYYIIILCITNLFNIGISIAEPQLTLLAQLVLARDGMQLYCSP